MSRWFIEELADLGSLPFVVEWPNPPTITSEVSVATEAEFETEAAVGQSGKRIRVTATIAGQVTIGGTDFEIVMDPGVELQGGVFVDKEVARVAFISGIYGAPIEFRTPIDFAGGGVERPEWQVRDVLIDGVEINSATTAIFARALRCAIINSKCRTTGYCVWGGNGSATLWNESIIIAGNDFHSTGTEATVRFVGARQTVVMHNVLDNDQKHAYRVHGVSRNFLSRHNVLLQAGVMIGSEVSDDCQDGWFEENTFHHTLPDMFNIDDTGRVLNFEIHDNTSFTNVWDHFQSIEDPETPHASWNVSNNQVQPYQEPPADVYEFANLAQEVVAVPIKGDPFDFIPPNPSQGFDKQGSPKQGSCFARQYDSSGVVLIDMKAIGLAGKHVVVEAYGNDAYCFFRALSGEQPTPVDPSPTAFSGNQQCYRLKGSGNGKRLFVDPRFPVLAVIAAATESGEVRGFRDET